MVLAGALAAPAWAHIGGDGFLGLDVTGEGVRGEWILSLAAGARAAGLDMAFAGDADRTGWLARHGDAVAAAVLASLRLTRDGHDCEPAGAAVKPHEDSNYLVLRFALRCAPRGAGELRLRDVAPVDDAAMGQHVVRLREDARTQLGLLDARHRALRFTLALPARGPLFRAFVRDGMAHIAMGKDHLLFLGALLLPAVLRYEQGRWHPRQRLADVLRDTLKVVTAFTLAHSLTLALAVLQMVWLPSRAVESAIAASVLLTALDNVRPRVTCRRWYAAFGFGLIHGFGFAGALTGLRLPDALLALALAGFNTGVELGQMALVTMLLPAAFALRHTRYYRPVLLQGGSALAIVWAGLWLAERALGLQLLPPALA
ncbi:HupE/UreJ family protein [Azohydromonas australica]|uniref:HupE/UreJ family protein n=1 Tax=Azohydromonas australica TaxID=364039 RepID=UPI0005BB711F|nr:HupE/UreJ family protein [Azohydromonas australica]